MAEQSQQKAKTFQGVPRELIEEACKIHEQVACYISRRNTANGRMHTLGKYIFSTKDLGDIETWLDANAGGGSYTIRPQRMDNTNVFAEPLYTFQVDVEGAPKPATAKEHGLVGVSAGGGTVQAAIAAAGGPAFAAPVKPVPPELYATLPEPVRTLTPQQQWDYINAQKPLSLATGFAYPQGVPYMKAPQFSSDELAAKQTDELRSEKERMGKEAKEREVKLQSELDALRKRLDEEKEERRRQEREAEQRMMQSQMESLRLQIAEAKATPAKPAFDLNAIVALVGAAAPFVTAIVTSSKDRAIAQVEQQQKAFEIQMRGLSEITNRPKEDPLKAVIAAVAAIGPLVMPALTELIKSKSPEAQANMYATMAESQMTGFSMIAQLTEQLAKMSGGSQEPVWLPMVQGMLGSVMTTAENYFASKQNGAPQPNQLPANAGNNATAPSAVQATPQNQATPGQTVAKLIVMHPSFPAEMKNQEWFEVVAALHDNYDVEHVAERAAELLTAMEEAGKIPASMIEAFEADPKKALHTLLAQMPITQADPAYVNKFIDSLVALLEAEEGAVEEPGAATVAPTNGSSNIKQQPFDLTPKTAPQRKLQPV